MFNAHVDYLGRLTRATLVALLPLETWRRAVARRLCRDVWADDRRGRHRPCGRGAQLTRGGQRIDVPSVSTTTNPRATLTTGGLSTHIVTAADAVSAEGIIKPRAVVIKCKEDGSDVFCKTAAMRPGAHYDGALLTIPIASDVGDALAKQSAFKYAYFIQETRKFRCPGARGPMVQTSAMAAPSQVIFRPTAFTARLY